jgi:hypothetical protein
MQAARVSKRHWSALLILQRSMLDIIDQSVIIVFAVKLASTIPA